jgi:hypothetical protein
MRAFIATIGLIFAGLAALGTGPARADSLDIPNTIPCHDFAKNFDGSWTAEPFTPAFDFGHLRNYKLESYLIEQGEFRIDGVDLWAVITKKCPG